MKYALWIVQVLLALVFVATGLMKLAMPVEQLGQAMSWVNDVPAWLVLLIGLAELAGGLGLLLPALTRIQPQLTALAGAGLALVMLFAAIFHLTRGETAMVVPNLILFLLAAFVAYGRWKWVPILPKSAASNAAVTTR